MARINHNMKHGPQQLASLLLASVVISYTLTQNEETAAKKKALVGLNMQTLARLQSQTRRCFDGSETEDDASGSLRRTRQARSLWFGAALLDRFVHGYACILFRATRLSGRLCRFEFCE